MNPWKSTPVAQPPVLDSHARLLARLDRIEARLSALELRTGTSCASSIDVIRTEMRAAVAGSDADTEETHKP